MPSILIIDRNSVIKPYNTKTFVEDELYKKAGFKSKEGFAKHSQWNVSIKNAPSIVELYGKTAGRAGQENKYDFPPPADNTLFFGSCVLVCKSGDNAVDISLAEWEKVYEQLFGGFDDIGANDSDDDDDDDEDDESIDDGVPKTKEGYVKDGFIVDDTEESDESEYEPVISSSKLKSTKKVPTPKTITYDGKPSPVIPRTPTQVVPPCVGVLTKSTKTPTSTKEKTPKKLKIPTQELAENIQIKIHPEIIVTPSTPIPTEEEFDPTYFSCTDELIEESYI